MKQNLGTTTYYSDQYQPLTHEARVSLIIFLTKTYSERPMDGDTLQYWLHTLQYLQEESAKNTHRYSTEEQTLFKLYLKVSLQTYWAKLINFLLAKPSVQRVL
jgi:hypothetical protein